MKRILVIEDTEDNRLILGDLLASAGYELIEAVDGLEGVATAEREQPDLILMDIQLPGIDGIEALGRLRGDPVTCDIPVIAVTASAMKQDRDRIMEAGFDDYQRKPLDIRDFVELVRRRIEAGRRRPA
jgi:two-component system cell cycle response regulator DivK